MTTDTTQASTTQNSTTQNRLPSRLAWWTGMVIGGLPALMMLVTGAMSLAMPMDEATQRQIREIGWDPEKMRTLVLIEMACALLYLVPQTAMLGAILLTGYLGGAVATHVRVGDGNWPFAVIFGVLLWLGLFLRDRRVRALVPLRRPCR